MHFKWQTCLVYFNLFRQEKSCARTASKPLELVAAGWCFVVFCQWPERGDRAAAAAVAQRCAACKRRQQVDKWRVRALANIFQADFFLSLFSFFKKQTFFPFSANQSSCCCCCCCHQTQSLSRAFARSSQSLFVVVGLRVVVVGRKSGKSLFCNLFAVFRLCLIKSIGRIFSRSFFASFSHWHWLAPRAGEKQQQQKHVVCLRLAWGARNLLLSLAVGESVCSAAQRWNRKREREKEKKKRLRATNNEQIRERDEKKAKRKRSKQFLWGKVCCDFEFARLSSLRAREQNA